MTRTAGEGLPIAAPDWPTAGMATASVDWANASWDSPIDASGWVNDV